LTEEYKPPAGYPAAAGKTPEVKGTAAVVPLGTAPVTVKDGMYDAHAHLIDFSQETEGIGQLLSEMDECGVSHAALFGCPLKKNWSEFEKRISEDVYNDTDILYYFSLTDLYLLNQLKILPPSQAGRFAPTLCGFKPTDRSAVKQVNALIESHPEVIWRGFGKIYGRFSEITNMTAGPVVNPAHPAFYMMMADASQRNMPVVLQHNACSESSKPYKTAFEYICELEDTLQKYSDVQVLWVDCGIYVRGQWAGYKDQLFRMLSENPNLHVSVTSEVLNLQKLTTKELTEMAEQFSDQVMVGSKTMGLFTKAQAYRKEWEIIQKWTGNLSKETAKKVLFSNAQKFYSVKEKKQTVFKADQNSFENKLMHSGTGAIIRTKSDKLHDQASAAKKDAMEPPEKNRMLDGMKDGVLVHDAEIKHVTIDIHLHMLDFLQKSAGTRKILAAMDGCGVEKAVMIGMPCCKKWSMSEPEQPLYYQDDNGQCYFYSYADQMVADAWLALPDVSRKRFAPVMGSFNPTDIAAVDHVERMWTKYPGLWRGLGEVMCRHDDLTSLLMEDETPVINHMAMRPIYEWCIEKDLNCMVHQNADRTAEAEDDGDYEYLWEVQQVLEAFPDLKLIWCHAGVSRRTFEENHHEMIDKMVSDYPNLHVDMSWVVWEECVCDPATAKPKKGWADLFEKHPTRFSIGSDQVGQFINPAGGNLLKPEIVKYWTIADVCSPETTKAVLHDNAQRVWFEGWDVPTSDKGGRWVKSEPLMKGELLYHHQGYFEWAGQEMY